MAMDDKWYEEVFALYDEDGSGAIDIDELGKAMKSVGLDMSLSELEELLKKIDKDGSHTIELDEFKIMVKQQMAKKDSPEEVDKAYGIFGDQKSGWQHAEGIDASVLRCVYESLGLPVDDAKIEEFVNAAGKNGVIDIDDWRRIMKEATEIEQRNAAESAALLQRSSQPIQEEEF